MNVAAPRWTGLAGVASFVLIITAALVSPPLWDVPDTTASAQEASEYLAEHRGRIIAGLFIYSLAMGLFLCFAAGLCVWLRDWERPPAPLSALFAIGAVALVVLIFVGFAPVGVGAYHADDPAFNPDLGGILSDLTFYLLALSGIPTTVCLGAYAALVLRGAPLPQWTAWLAILGAAAHGLIAASLFGRSGVLSLEGEVIIFVPATFFAWILAAGASILRIRPG